MRNLLTNKIKQRLEKEYRLRLLIVVLFVSSSILFLATFLLFPSYILLRTRMEVVLSQAQLVEQGIVGKQAKTLSETLRTTQSQLNLFDSIQKKKPLSLRVNEIIDNKPKDIDITSFFYTTVSDSESLLTLAGVASTRDALLTFERSLKAQSDFSSVTLPVSNLAKQSDIPFSLTIKGSF